VKQAKESIHETVQAGLTNDSTLSGSVLIKWVIVLECAMPDGSHSVIRMTSDADGQDLYKWETAGLLATALGES